MTLFQAVILGIVQGIAEFLPISSSGHLVIVPFLLSWELNPETIFPFDILVHLGTLAAVVVYFWKDLFAVAADFLEGLKNRRPFDTLNSRLGWYIIIATIPAGLLGILIKDTVEAAFNDPSAVAFFLLGTAALLFLSDFFGDRKRELRHLNWLDALWIGVLQALAIFPGLSRSGSTITGGILRNFHPRDAARFSFLMAVPALIGASIFGLRDLLKLPELASFAPIMFAGFVVSGIVGLFSIRWLMQYLNRQSLKTFAWYCIAASLVVLLKLALL